MRPIKIIPILLIISLCACSKESSLKYGVYKFSDEYIETRTIIDLEIVIFENGTFQYISSAFSNPVGGNWEIADGLVSLKDDWGIHYLYLNDNKLVYISNSSDSFPYVKVRDGAELSFIKEW